MFYVVICLFQSITFAADACNKLRCFCYISKLYVHACIESRRRDSGGSVGGLGRATKGNDPLPRLARCTCFSFIAIAPQKHVHGVTLFEVTLLLIFSS